MSQQGFHISRRAARLISACRLDIVRHPAEIALISPRAAHIFLDDAAVISRVLTSPPAFRRPEHDIDATTPPSTSLCKWPGADIFAHAMSHYAILKGAISSRRLLFMSAAKSKSRHGRAADAISLPRARLFSREDSHIFRAAFLD